MNYIDYLQAGIKCVNQKKYLQSIQYWKKGIQHNPNNAVDYLNICRSYCFLEQYKDALGYGRKAVQLDPKEGYAHINLARAWCGLNYFENAIKHANLGVKYSYDKLTLCQRAKIFMKAGMRKECIQDIQEIQNLIQYKSSCQANHDYINETFQELKLYQKNSKSKF